MQITRTKGAKIKRGQIFPCKHQSDKKDINSRLGKKKSNVPIHGTFGQLLVSVSLVKHLYFIREAIGSSQERVLLCTPKPQVTEQSDQAVQTGSGQVPVIKRF